jgi:hypothetical protein
MASNKGVEEVKTMKTREVTFKVTRHEWWYPVYKVPAHLTNDEALEYVQDKQPDEMYDEYNNKHTYEQECWIELEAGGDTEIREAPFDQPGECFYGIQAFSKRGETQ